MEIKLEELKKAIEKNEKERRKWTTVSIILIVAGIALSFSLVAFFPESELVNNIGQSMILLVFLGVMILVIAYSNEKYTIAEPLKIIYYLAKLKGEIECLQSPEITKGKARVKKKEKIGKILLKIEKIVNNLELSSKRHKFSDRIQSDINFFRRIIFKINSSLKEDKPIKNEVLNTLTEYYNKRIPIFEKYDSETIDLNKKILNDINPLLQEEDEKLINSFYFYKLKYIGIPRNLIRIIVLFIALIIEGGVFFYILPTHVSVEFKDQMTWTLLAYGTTTLIIFKFFDGN